MIDARNHCGVTRNHAYNCDNSFAAGVWGSTLQGETSLAFPLYSRKEVIPLVRILDFESL
eukprot:111800-Amphidinium_carterae.2